MRPQLVEHLNGLEPIEGQHRFVSKLGKELGKRVAEGVVVVDNENKVFFTDVHRLRFHFGFACYGRMVPQGSGEGAREHRNDSGLTTLV
jgi:hypothetical protein